MPGITHPGGTHQKNKKFQPQMHADETRGNRMSKAHGLRKSGLNVAQQQAITVTHDRLAAGDYSVDLLAERTIIVKMNAIKALDNAHTAQCLNYLRATDLRLCLLLNFGKPRLEIQRVAHGLWRRSVPSA